MELGCVPIKFSLWHVSEFALSHPFTTQLFNSSTSTHHFGSVRQCLGTEWLQQEQWGRADASITNDHCWLLCVACRQCFLWYQHQVSCRLLTEEIWIPPKSVIPLEEIFFTRVATMLNITLELSEKYVQKRKLRANWDEHLTRSKKQFGSSLVTSLKQALAWQTHGKCIVCPSLPWFP
jgi:hypothetical protein